jgi:hypothetical protein
MGRCTGSCAVAEAAASPPTTGLETRAPSSTFPLQVSENVKLDVMANGGQ